MKRVVGFAQFAAFATMILLIPAPASAGMKIVDGQSYWTGDPGPVDPGAYWNAGQYRFDPHQYLSWYGRDPQDYKMTVYATHSGPKGCVWRQRVVNTNWEFRHPYLQVCD
ncbi:hypothetical protein [Rhodoblastus sp.]|jgi:hypothetical protein|uniref:hypothetical protein n=1 Tax=Rhodoblastus sp. TaxID=1962975 RepID=UPI002605E4E4|nr:hypothetical protein [Rhodoblastus sp.]